MSAGIENPPPTDIAAFDAFLNEQADAGLWELVAGRIVMMTNPSENHEQIAATSARGLDKPRPDVLTRCGAPSNRHDVTDPLVIVEVLSPSTMDGDRGDMLRFYKSLPTAGPSPDGYPGPGSGRLRDR